MAGPRTFPLLEVPHLLALKRRLTVSVCVPARDEATTLGPIVVALVGLAEQGLIDEILVIDDGSTDATALVARNLGARVIRSNDRGKGAALALGLATTSGDIVACCDADIAPFRAEFVSGLLGPLFSDSSVALVKAAYSRSLDGREGEGGRVTELMARPILRALFPSLAAVHQPLAGEWAGRRPVLQSVKYESDYGVDIGVLIDVAQRWGAHALAEVRLGDRSHRNRPVKELSVMADQVLAAALARIERAETTGGSRSNLQARPA